MLLDYLPILILVVLAALFAGGTMVISALLGPRRPTPEKLSPYECGIEPVGTARERFSVKFYLVAMLFIIFDMETVFLYPLGGGVQGAQAVRCRRHGDLPPDPAGRLRLRLEEGRAGVGLRAESHEPRAERGAKERE